MTEPIAIVGAGSRVPGAEDGRDGLWRLFSSGRHAITEVPPGRWDAGECYRYGAFLADATGFDAAYFGIRPGEAKQMDPQQRILLEVATDALRDAGISPGSLSGSRTAVYTSSIAPDYWLMHARSAGFAGIDTSYATGKEPSFGAGRISYLLGLTGPAMSVGSACSSSLVGVHLGCRSLRLGEADVALAGGSSLILSPELSMFMSEVGALAEDGLCKVFDARADGTVRGEACVTVVLKRLSDALADGDDVLAVIRGSAVNHNGHSAGLTVPNGAAQQRVIDDALADAAVDPRHVGYLEAHGTGTALGDPIEMGSAAAVLGVPERRESPLLVGSAKTNLGHTDAAAGLVGLLKAALALRSESVPPHLHFTDPHPGIRWDDWPVRVPTETVPWPRGHRSRFAGVSAFGLSGTNAHVVLEEPPGGPAPERPSDGPVTLPIAARHPAALRELAARHRDRVGELAGQGTPATGYAYATATACAEDGEHRAAVTADDTAGLHERLTELAAHGFATGAALGTATTSEGTVFVFSGQGAQWPGMACALLDEPAFAAALDACDELIAERAGWSVRAELESGSAARYLTSTEYAQPVIFSLQVALATLWRDWGVRPAAVVGHSMGEVAAAHVAGALDLPSAVDVITVRGRLLEQAAGQGRMVAAELPADDAGEWLARVPGVDIAAENGPTATVFSGDPMAIETLLEGFDAHGVGYTRMPGTHAFHGRQMRRFAEPLREELRGLSSGEPEIPVVTTAGGARPPFGPGYWVANVTEPVTFAGAVRQLTDGGHRRFAELGPHATLGRPLTALLDEAGVPDAAVTSSLRRDRDALTTMRTALGVLWTAGEPVSWERVGERDGVRHRQPGYPWQHEQFWFDTPGTSAGPAMPAAPASPAGQREAGTAPRPDRDLEGLVVSAVAGLLGVDESDVDRNRGFAELGLDSLAAVELRKSLQSALGRALPATIAFDHPTVRRLAAFLGDQRRPDSGRAAPRAGATEATDDAVAVVGIGCRFPGGGTGPEGFWRMLTGDVDAVTEVPSGRFPDSGGWYGGFLGSVDEFDARFFRIPPKQARVMDPQQRMFLEVSWEALEHGGIPPDSLDGTRTGVFAGLNSNDHAALLASDPTAVDGFYGTGNSFSGTPGQLSYFLGARGPSVAVDTACSSSLVAVHQALVSLRRGESDVAIAGGVNAILRSTIHRSSEDLGALASDGRCKAFDASADGYTRGEGCGVVVLKRLPDAIRAGDDVLAVLLGSAVNSDGASSGLTVPNGPAQEDLVREALADAGVTAADVGYVEAHGTGTALGDPIELEALGAALGDRDSPCWVGSVKSNIGHLEAASGIAGLIKAVLAVRHGEVPRSLHVTEPTPEVDWSALPLRVPTERTPWSGEQRRIAGVSAFGFTGTNAHVVLAQGPREEPAERPPEPEGACHLLPLSAATRQALPTQAGALRAYLAGNPEVRLDDVCATASLRRSHLAHRTAVVGRSRQELLDRLSEVERGEATAQPAEAASGLGEGTVFVFSGHGGQWKGMARTLLAEQSAFAEGVRRCSGAMLPHLGWSVYDLLAQGGEPESEEAQQDLVFAIQVGLAGLWRSWGVRPAAVVGHSMGEVAAAHVAGALDLGTAARLICLRSTFIARVIEQGGGMVLVGLPQGEAEQEIAGFERLWVAVSNSSKSTVVSGDRTEIERLVTDLSARNVFCKPVKAGGAGHCPYVEPLAEEFAGELSWLTAHEPRIPFYSAVTGQPETDLGPGYWGRNMHKRVRFADATRRLAADGHDTFVELSAHPLLLTAVEQEVGALTAGSLVRDGDDTAELLRSLGHLHSHGHPVDFRGVHRGNEELVSLPHYAWHHRSYRLEVSPMRAVGDATPAIFTSGDGSETVSLLSDVSTQVSRCGAERAEASVWLTALARLAGGQFHGSTVELSGVDLDDLGAEGDAPVRLALEFPPGCEEAEATAEVSGAGTALAARLRPGATMTATRGGTEQPRECTARGDTARQHEAVAGCLLAATGDDGAVPAHIESVFIGQGFERWSPTAWYVRASKDGTDGEDGADREATVLDDTGTPMLTVRGVQAETRDEDHDGLLRGLAWTEVPRTDTPAAERALCVLGDPEGLGRAVAERLEAEGHPAVLTTVDDCAAELAALRGSHDRVGAVHLLADAPAELAGEVPGRACADVATVSAGAGRAAVWHVTAGAQQHGRRGRAVAGQAPVWGVARACALEHPESWGGLLDLDPLVTDTRLLAEQIVAEVSAPDGEDQLCLRGRRRYARRVTPDPARGRAPRLSAGGSHLVVAEPDLAGPLARWLAERGARHVLVLGGEPAPDVRADLAAGGVDVRTTPEDPADAEAVAALRDRLADEGTPVRGVVWAPVDWTLGEAAPDDPDVFARAVRQRVVGAWTLHDTVPELELFVVFTSAASAWGAIGSAVQGAADEPLTALVEWRRATGRQATAVQWAPWQGTALADDTTLDRMGRTGISALDPARAPAALHAAVGRREPLVSVVDADEQLMVAFYRQVLRYPLFDELGSVDADSGSALADELAAAPADQRHGLLVDAVLRELAAVLGMDSADEIAEHEGLFELGMNSTGALELRLRLQRLAGLELPATLAFEHPTPLALAGELAARLGVDGEPGTAEPPAETASENGDGDDLLTRFESEMSAARAAADER